MQVVAGAAVEIPRMAGLRTDDQVTLAIVRLKICVASLRLERVDFVRNTHEIAADATAVTRVEISDIVVGLLYG